MDPFFVWANWIESGLWSALGIGFALYSLRGAVEHRRRARMAAGVLVVFGMSDLVEAQTGAWYRPWWLFVWKAICVAGLLGLVVTHYRARSRKTHV